MSRLGATAGVLFVVVGCSLVVGEIPEPLQRDAGIGQSGGVSGGPSGGTSSGPQGGTSAAGGAPDVPDAGPPVAGTSGEPDAAAGAQPPMLDDAGFDPCDRDGDGEPNEDCGGDDCDDDDRRVHPNQEEYFDQESETVVFDYNCSDMIEREYPEPLSCMTTDLSLCDTDVQGFLDALPQCGEEGAWGHCVAQRLVGTLPGMCTSQIDQMRRAACH